MAKPLMSQTELKRRRKTQAAIGRTTSTLGLTGVGLLGASAVLKKPKIARGVGHLPGMHNVNTKKLESAALRTGVVSSGIGGVGGFNQAAIYGDEARRRTAAPKPKLPTKPKKPVKKAWAPVATKGAAAAIEHKRRKEFGKIGEWKTIDQREQTQRRDRKAMRRAGAGAAFGGGLVALGYHENNDKAAYKAAGKTAHAAFKHPEISTKDAIKGSARVAGMAARELSSTGKVGAGLIAGAAAVGTGAKAHHTYQQHKINERRRSNFKKSAFGVEH